MHVRLTQTQYFSAIDLRTATAFSVPFLIYLLTLAPTVYQLDSAELTTAASTLGLTRATGYPLYILLAHIFSKIPIGDIGFRANLFSAFNGALTIALLERVLRELKLNTWATLGALGALAFSIYFWSLSVIAEVYTLHTALLAAIILALLKWADDFTPTRLALVGLLIGLSMGNHVSTLFVIPGCVWYLLTVNYSRVLTPRTLVLGFLGGLIGFAVYLYLPIRYAASPVFNYAGRYDANGVFHPLNLQTLEGFWWLVSGKDFSSLLFNYGGIDFLSETIKFGANLWRAFYGLGLGPGFLGLIVLLHRNWKFGIMTLLVFAAHTIFYISYGAVDKDLMCLPSYLFWIIWMAVGFDWLLDLIKQTIPKEKTGLSKHWSSWFVHGAILSIMLVSLIMNWSQVDSSHDWSSRERGETILDQLEPNALLFGYWDTVPLVEYLQLVEGRRPDVQVINRFLIESKDLRQLIQQEVGQRPVYIDNPFSDQLTSVSRQPDGILFKFIPRE